MDKTVLERIRQATHGDRGADNTTRALAETIVDACEVTPIGVSTAILLIDVVAEVIEFAIREAVVSHAETITEAGVMIIDQAATQPNASARNAEIARGATYREVGARLCDVTDADVVHIVERIQHAFDVRPMRARCDAS